MSISEREIWACANEVVRRYGKDASIHTAQRADEFVEKSALGRHRTWLRILRAIERLENKVPPSERLN